MIALYMAFVMVIRPLSTLEMDRLSMRVNQQIEHSHKLLESIKSKLMADNYDYDTSGEIKTTKKKLNDRFTIMRNNYTANDVRPTAHQWQQNQYKLASHSRDTPYLARSAQSQKVTIDVRFSVPTESNDKILYKDTEFKKVDNARIESMLDEADDKENDVNSLVDEKQINSKVRIRNYPLLRSEDNTESNDIDFKFLRLKHRVGDDGTDEVVIVTSKDGLFPQIRLSDTRRQYMETDSGE